MLIQAYVFVLLMIIYFLDYLKICKIIKLDNI